MFKRLKNIEDNLVEVGDSNNKVEIFQIIKDIKYKGIKISNDDEAIREIGEHIKKLIDDGVKVNNFDKMKKEIRNRIQNLKDENTNVNINNNQINDLVNKIGIGKRGLTSRDTSSGDSFSEDTSSKDSLSENVDIKHFFKKYKKLYKNYL